MSTQITNLHSQSTDALLAELMQRGGIPQTPTYQTAKLVTPQIYKSSRKRMSK